MKETARGDGRAPNELRPVRFEPGFTRWAEGSVLASMGETRVLCTVSIEESVPPFLRDSGRGWVTAEYGMLPRSTHTRTDREAARGKVKGRTHEIQRLIGRSLRAVVDLEALGERSLLVDCDVLQADGGTRTAAVTGSWVALRLATSKLVEDGLLTADPLLDAVAAVSVGLIDGVPCLDLCYEEDSRAEVDMNVVMTGAGKFVEVQGTAEGAPFSREELDRLADLAADGIAELLAFQRTSVEGS